MLYVSPTGWIKFDIQLTRANCTRAADEFAHAVSACAVTEQPEGARSIELRISIKHPFLHCLASVITF
jgi:hypothetical protein